MAEQLFAKAEKEFSRARAFERVDAARSAEHYAKACILEAAAYRAAQRESAE